MKMKTKLPNSCQVCNGRFHVGTRLEMRQRPGQPYALITDWHRVERVVCLKCMRREKRKTEVEAPLKAMVGCKWDWRARSSKELPSACSI